MARFIEYDLEFVDGIDFQKFLPQENHICRIVQRIVSELNLSRIEDTYSEKGRSALAPQMMLSIIFYGYMVGVRSGRKLEVACQEDLKFIYLSQGHQPKKTSINEFRRKHFEQFNDLFIQVIKFCQEEGLGDNAVCIVDGSKIRANSSKRLTKDKAQYEKWLQTLSEDIEDLSSNDKDLKGEVKKNCN